MREPEEQDSLDVEEPLEAEIEVLDALPVLPGAHALERPAPGTVPALQAAAMAATSFVAGAAAMALARRYAARRLADAVALERPPQAWPVGTTRTYLVNVRLISRPGE